MAYYTYKRSNNINVLKHTKESITTNYSSEQYMAALDTLVSYACDPVLRSSNYFDSRLVEIMSGQVSSPTKKFSALSREALLLSLSKFLTTHNVQEKKDLLQKMRLHRNHTLSFLSEWVRLLDGYRQAYLTGNEAATSVSEALVYHKPEHDSLFACLEQTKYWLNQALKLRSMILEKYHRLVVNEAVFLYKQLSHSVDLDDLTQLMMSEALSAIDRCDTDKGPITSFLQQYLRFSGRKINFEYDSVYEMKGTKRTDYTHKAQELESDSLSQSTEMVTFSESDYVRYLARKLDPTGIGRYLLEIEEYAPALRDLSSVKAPV